MILVSTRIIDEAAHYFDDIYKAIAESGETFLVVFLSKRDEFDGLIAHKEDLN